MDIVRHNFNDRDIRCILAIPLKESCQKDELSWAFSKNGLYSVKSAYMLGKGCDLDSFHNAWVDLWKLNVRPKTRNFLWRFGTATLPVRSLLKYRHLTENGLCPWCEKEEETWRHAFFECDRVHDLWSGLDCNELRKFECMDTACNLIESWRDAPTEMRIRGAYLMWGIWLDRNIKVFQGKTTPIAVLVSGVQRWCEDNEKYNKAIYASPAIARQTSSKVWLAPPDGWIKLNTDASLSEEGWVGIGVVARDSLGNVLFSACKRLKVWWQSEIAEAKAVVWALKLGRRFGIDKAIIETNWQVVTNRLAKGATHLTDLDAVLCDAMCLGTAFERVCWSHVCREGNEVAHNLARVIPYDVEQIWENRVPLEVSPYVLMDTLILND